MLVAKDCRYTQWFGTSACSGCSFMNWSYLMPSQSLLWLYKDVENTVLRNLTSKNAIIINLRYLIPIATGLTTISAQSNHVIFAECTNFSAGLGTGMLLSMARLLVN